MPKGVPNKRYTPEFKKLVVETMMKEKIELQRNVLDNLRISNHHRVQDMGTNLSGRRVQKG